MHRAAPVLLLALLPGCAFFQKAKDTFEGLTNPLVALGFVISVEPAPSEDVDLTDAPVQQGTALTVMLADAAQVNDLDEVPVEDADVSLEGAAATEIDVGIYAIEPGPLTWDDGATWDLHVGIGDDLATAAITLPPASTWAPPTSHAPSTDLVVDLTGQDYDSVFVIVIDQDGNLTYSNEPETPREIYDFTHGDAELTVTVPGSEAFPAAGVYLIGVAGMQHTGASDLDEMNTALSTLLAGKMIIHPLPVGTL